MLQNGLRPFGLPAVQRFGNRRGGYALLTSDLCQRETKTHHQLPDKPISSYPDHWPSTPALQHLSTNSCRPAFSGKLSSDSRFQVISPCPPPVSQHQIPGSVAVQIPRPPISIHPISHASPDGVSPSAPSILPPTAQGPRRIRWPRFPGGSQSCLSRTPNRL